MPGTRNLQVLLASEVTDLTGEANTTTLLDLPQLLAYPYTHR